MKKNLLHLVPSFHQGGSELQALQLAGLLAADGTFNVGIACLDRGGPLTGFAERMGFAEIPDFPLTTFYDLNMGRQIRRFVRYLKEKQIDIIQSHDFYTNIFGMLAGKMAGVPVMVAAKRETGMRSAAQLFIERRAFGFADVIIANSGKVRNYLISSGVPASKIEVVHNGIDLTRFQSSTKDKCTLLGELGISEVCPTRLVTIVANLRDPVKNHGMFLRAAALVAQKTHNVVFAAAGEGGLADEMKSIADGLGISGQTYFLGRCDRVPDLLSVSSICVLTSNSEGFSNSILEYMAAGKPVIATAVGGADEAVIQDETGFLIRPGDHDQLAKHIVDLLDDRALADSMGQKGKARAVECFSTATQVARSLALYDKELRRAGIL